jgi:protein-S-isoprenylcysteine O-methyltransferase Ste14
MALQTVAILLVWSFPEPQIPLWRFGAGALFAALGTVTTWLSLKQLGRQWRLDAGLNAGHELVQDGPYAVVRHPLYAGTFAVMLSVGLLVTEWPVLICSAILYEIGTEIRMRSEDRLLRERFGAAFDEYASRVPGHIPFLK